MSRRATGISHSFTMWGPVYRPSKPTRWWCVMSGTSSSLWGRVRRSLKSLFGTSARKTAPATNETHVSPPAAMVSDGVQLEKASPPRFAAPQTPGPVNSFALAARLAAVGKLNVASARAPKWRAYQVPPARAIPMAIGPAIYARHPARLSDTNPTARIIKATRTASAMVIDLETARRPVQNIRKRAT